MWKYQRLILICSLIIISISHSVPSDMEQSLRTRMANGDLDATHSLADYLSKKAPEHHAEALQLLKTAAKAGHAPAQYNLAVTEFNGDLGVKDRSSAWMWMKLASLANFDTATEMLKVLSKELEEKEIARGEELLNIRRTQWNIEAARNGNSRAAVKAGIALIAGTWVTKDEHQGISFLRQAAKAGESSAMLVLASKYENGRGIPKDLSLAKKYYLMAAKHRSREAMYELARFLYRGIFSEPQPILAAAWLKLAAEYDHKASREAYESLIPELSDEQIELVDKLSNLGASGLVDSGWFVTNLKSNVEGFVALNKSPWPHELFTNQSDRQLGYVMEGLPSGLKNWRDATFNFNEKLATEGQPEAMFNHAITLLMGLNGIRDLRKVVQLLEDASARGLKQASSLLGFLTIVGPGVELESAREMLRLEQLTERADSEAQYLLGRVYQLGLQGVLDLTKSRNFYEQASRQGHLQASEELARFYTLGLGGVRKQLEAWVLWDKLAKLNWPNAKKRLHDLEVLMGPARVDQAKALADRKPTQVSVELTDQQTKPAKVTVAKKVSPLAKLKEQANAGSAESQYKLAKLYLDGNGVEKDLLKAYQWLEKAALQEYAEACFDLAIMIINSQGVKFQYDKARSWLKKASNLGISEARKKIMELDLRIGQSAYQAFDNKKALKIFEELKKDFTNDPIILLSVTKTLDSLGLDLFNAGKKQDAEKTLVLAMETAADWQKKHPNDAQAYVYLAVTTGNLARFKGGKERVQIGSKVEGYCLKAIETDANVGRPYVILATYYWEVSKLNWMLKAFAKSFLGKLPDKTRDDALKLYLTGLEKDNNQIYGHFKIAQLYEAMGKKDKAAEHRKIMMGLKAKNSGDQRILDEFKKGS